MEKTTKSLKTIDLAFLYLDLTLCDRCRGTDANLDEALSEIAGILRGAAVEVSLGKIQVRSEAKAERLGLVSSPTIRINGRDIAPEFRESRCGACETVSGMKGIDCRTWLFQGKEYTVAPKDLIIDAILREVYGGSAREEAPLPKGVPENLRTFFEGKAASSCCAPAKQVVCCEASEKERCCGNSPAGGCGCKD